MPKSIDQHEGKKYLRRIVGRDPDDINHKVVVLIDVYDAIKAFGVTCPARAHAIKKLLCAGNRGKGDVEDDLLGVEAAVARAIELNRDQIDIGYGLPDSLKQFPKE